MVSKQNIASLTKATEQVNKYSVVGILDMHKMPAGQLFAIRNKLRGKATITMYRKRVLERALAASKHKDVARLTQRIQGEPALLLSNENPFKLARVIATAKSPAKAKAGDIAPYEIIIHAGPTPLPPGPAIGDLQKLKLPVGVEGDKIAVKADTVVAKKGDVISRQLADVLGKLNITPMEVSLNLVAAWENGIIYNSDVMFVPQEEYMNRVLFAGTAAFNLSVFIGYPTSQNIRALIGKANRQAKALSVEAGIPTKDTIGALLAKGQAIGTEVKKHVKEAPAAETAENSTQAENPKQNRPTQASPASSDASSEKA